MVVKGFFIVADITGYTEFLTQSELEHAELVLDILFKAQIDHFTSPIVVNSFRGDGILAYALDGSIANGDEMIERLNQVYYSYSTMRELMYMNVTCPCNACQNIQKLDLKLFVHHGSFMLQKVGDREEMLGPDVIVVHRMMKNQVKEQTGIQAYVLITEAAAEVLEFGDQLKGMTPYTDEYEHIGTVRMLVHDLNKAFRDRKDAQRQVIKSEEAHVAVEADFPISAVRLWEYLVNPELKQQWCHLSERTAPEFDTTKDSKPNQLKHDWDMVNASVVDYAQNELCTMEGIGFHDTRYRATLFLSPTLGKNKREGVHVKWHLTVTRGDSEHIREDYAIAMQASFDRLSVMIATSEVNA